jgi:DNA-nicking Smr family endonuclease
MTTVFGKEEREFYNAFFIEDLDRRQTALTKWITSAVPVIQNAVGQELESLLDFISQNAKTDEEWKERQDKLKQIENECHLVLEVKLRRIDHKEKIIGNIPEPIVRFEIGSRRKNIEQVPKAIMSKKEIDLHGMTVTEATLYVNDFLKDCCSTNEREVWVIHGKGTGVLKDAVRKLIAHHSLVDSFSVADPSHGGEGAMRVILKQ